MKIGIISDLHVDSNELANEPFVEEVLLNKVQHLKLDLLIIAGDISNDVYRSLKVLHRLRDDAGIPVLFVPGNHDYWSKVNGITDTWEIYRKFQEFDGCLSERPYALGEDWVVIGNSGWYDYSFGDPHHSFVDYERMYFMDRTWQDSLYVQWDRGNQEMHRYFYETLERELELHKGKNIILVTHMLSNVNFTVPLPNPQWAYFNAFLGSREYTDLYRKYDVRYSIMGHVHYRKQFHDHETELICACLGNRQEWRTTDVRQEIDSTLRILELPVTGFIPTSSVE